MFKQKKMWFPEEMKGSAYMNELEEELRNVSRKGFKSKHDDVADTISMLSELEPYKPNIESSPLTTGYSDTLESFWGSGWDSDLPSSKQGSTIF